MTIDVYKYVWDEPNSPVVGLLHKLPGAVHFRLILPVGAVPGERSIKRGGVTTRYEVAIKFAIEGKFGFRLA